LRELPVDRSAVERVRDWNEFHHHMDDKRLRQQGARCMDCGVPFCHTGKLISGMASGCPVNNLIPEWNDLVFRGLWREALERLHKTNNFPESRSRTSRMRSSIEASMKAGSSRSRRRFAPARKSLSSVQDLRVSPRRRS
jgi:hypothetical protein